jgi:hypothetical protein
MHAPAAIQRTECGGENRREYSVGGVECAYTIDQYVYEANLFLVVGIEQPTQQTKLNVGGLPSGILTRRSCSRA